MNISTAIKLQDKFSPTMKNAKNAADNASKSFATVDVNIKKIDSSIKKSSSSAGSFLKGLMGFSVLKGIFSSITSQIDGAISRFDTLNNYPKVLKNLGFSAEESQASIDTLSERLKGIPTRLDEAASGVQRFIAANGDVEASTEMWLAMNDAILAGGANEASRAAAIEQLTQAYSKGAFEANEWKSVLQAMPGQLDQMAKKLGYTSTAIGGDFYKAMQKGTISMNDFMRTMVELDQEGIDGMANFHQQAIDASDGIQTAISNMQSAIQRGWVAMIDNANKALEASGLPTIQQIITDIGTNLETMMKRIGNELIPTLVGYCQELGTEFNNLGSSITALKDSNDENVNEMLDLWDYFMIGLQTIALGIDVAWTALKIGVLTVKLVFQTALSGIVTAFTSMYLAVKGIIVLVKLKFQDMVNWVIDGINNLIDGFNGFSEAVSNLSGGLISLGKASHIQSATFGSEAADNYLKEYDEVSEFALDRENDYKNTALDIVELQNESQKRWAEKSADLVEDLQKRRNKDTSKKAEETSNGRYDPNKINNLANNVNAATGNDSGGGKAIKTTTNDNLLKDEDIQLLLDVATRDYKLTYQQVTPNITLTFGDVRETADVDDILDKVADRLEEIYDGNLEVARV